MRVIAWYLPQFHRTEENDKWWGEGFTEWTNVKRAKKINNEQYQPREPLDDNYYNLLDDNTKKWQIEIAREHGIYGFCMHHYWFNGKKLLEKPVDQYLENKELNFPFCLCWANEHWTNSWAASGYKILIEQQYGDKNQWLEHFNYLLPFFKDERYIKQNDMPVFVIYKPELIDCLNEMTTYWQDLARQNGLKGICFCSTCRELGKTKKAADENIFSYCIEYQPSYALSILRKKIQWLIYLKDCISKYVSKIIKVDISRYGALKLTPCNYSEVWKVICDTRPSKKNCIPGAFVDWDNSPRKGNRGSFMVGASPKVFYEYFKKQVDNAIQNYNTDLLFIFAWNEWAEGGYLEPDKKNGLGYLQAIKKVLDEKRDLM